MIVQRDLDRILSPPRGRLVNWNWFFVLYALLLVGAAVGIYQWDTKLNLRQQLGHVLGMGRRPRAGQPRRRPRRVAEPLFPLAVERRLALRAAVDHRVHRVHRRAHSVFHHHQLL